MFRLHLAYAGEVGGVGGADVGEAVGAELLEEGVGQNERDAKRR